MSSSFRVLLVDQELITWTGAKIVLRDFALNLAKRGHRPVVWSPRTGAAADAFRELGIRVIDELSELETPPDIIHAHHNLTTALALATFPGVPAVMFCHSVFWQDIPISSPRIWRHIAVDRTRRDFLVKENRVPADRVVVIPNAVDLARFPPREEQIPVQASRCLAFCKTGVQLDMMRRACAMRGLDYDQIGHGAGHIVLEPEHHFRREHLVIATGRGALEAAIAGAAVVIADAYGMCGMLTSRNVRARRKVNFGVRCQVHPLTMDNFLREIDKYDHEDAARVSMLLRQEADLEDALDQVEQIYADALAAGLPDVWTDDDRAGLEAFEQTWLLDAEAQASFAPEREQLRSLIASHR